MVIFIFWVGFMNDVFIGVINKKLFIYCILMIGKELIRYRLFCDVF